MKEDREGYYLCQAHNGIGTDIGKVIQLKVNCTILRIIFPVNCFNIFFLQTAASPYFSAPSRMVTVKKGDTALLQCEVNGDKPINVLWLRAGKHELNPSTNYRLLYWGKSTIFLFDIFETIKTFIEFL